LWYILIRAAISATNHTTVKGLHTLSPVGIFFVASESPMITLASVARNRTLPVFRSCLQKCTPSHCPVCRGVYRKEKIKKLHVETTVVGRDETSRASSPSVIAEYLQMVAMVSGEGVLDVDVERVSTRVDGWIGSLPQNLKLQVSCRFFASAFCSRTASVCGLRSRFLWHHNRWQLTWGRKFSCAWVADADKIPCYSHNRSALRSNPSNGVEK
jgi:hypothetical protein